MACSKFILTNTGSTIVYFSYRRCDDTIWDYQVELFPNQTKKIWAIDGTYTVASAFKSSIVLVNEGSSPSTSATPTATPALTATPTHTPTSTPTLTPTPTAVYYYYFLLSCDSTHNKIGRSVTGGLSNTIYNPESGFCYQIVGSDNGPSFDYDLDELTTVPDCSDTNCQSTPTPTPTNTETPTNTPTNTETPTQTPTPTPTSYSGDLTLVFGNFIAVDTILPGGFDSLSDWNTALIASGNPYTSIVVDEPNYTIYLSGGSNIQLNAGAFTGNYEGGMGLGESLISIIDTGTIIVDTNTTFNYCQYLETVNLPALVNVGGQSFQDNTKLRNVQLPSVTSVELYGFFGAFNTADSPMTLYLPLCTSFGTNTFLYLDGFFGYIGTTQVDSPKVMNATFSNAITVGQAEIDLLLAENTGVIATYV